jgi:Ribosomal protein S8e
MHWRWCAVRCNVRYGFTIGRLRYHVKRRGYMTYKWDFPHQTVVIAIEICWSVELLITLFVAGLIGISRDKWHKRRPTGGRQAQVRKKRKFELGRPAANTKVRLCLRSLETRREWLSELLSQFRNNSWCIQCISIWLSCSTLVCDVLSWLNWEQLARNHVYSPSV